MLDVTTTRFMFIFYLFSGLLIGFILGFMIDPVNLAVKDGTMMLDKCYQGYCSEYIWLEKNTACFEGCKFLSQNKYGLVNFSNPNGDRDLYHSCIELCDYKYRDKWGNYDGN